MQTGWHQEEGSSPPAGRRRTRPSPAIRSSHLAIGAASNSPANLPARLSSDACTTIRSTFPTPWPDFHARATVSKPLSSGIASPTSITWPTRTSRRNSSMKGRENTVPTPDNRQKPRTSAASDSHVLGSSRGNSRIGIHRTGTVTRGPLRRACFSWSSSGPERTISCLIPAR